MDEQGRILDEAAFTNTKEGLASLIERIKPYGEAKAVLESTGNFWLKSYEALEKERIHVSLSNPLKTRAIAEARIKTDNHYEPFYQVKGMITFSSRGSHTTIRGFPHLPRIRSYEAHSLLKLRG